jgi:hypothetical protein
MQLLNVSGDTLAPRDMRRGDTVWSGDNGAEFEVVSVEYDRPAPLVKLKAKGVRGSQAWTATSAVAVDFTRL